MLYSHTNVRVGVSLLGSFQKSLKRSLKLLRDTRSVHVAGVCIRAPSTPRPPPALWHDGWDGETRGHTTLVLAVERCIAKHPPTARAVVVLL